MIGTPTLWKSKVLKNTISILFYCPSDDTDLCYRVFKKGYVFGGSKGVVLHVHRSNMKDFIKNIFGMEKETHNLL